MEKGPENAGRACSTVMNIITLTANQLRRKWRSLPLLSGERAREGIVFLGNAAVSPFGKTKNWSITKRLRKNDSSFYRPS